MASKEFIVRTQQSEKTVNVFAYGLSYPSEASTSGVLLQRFLTDLKAPVSRQVLLRSKPNTFEQAIKEATKIEQRRA